METAPSFHLNSVSPILHLYMFRTPDRTYFVLKKLTNYVSNCIKFNPLLKSYWEAKQYICPIDILLLQLMVNYVRLSLAPLLT